MEEIETETPIGDSDCSPPLSKKKIGLILDVESSILDQLLKFDDPNSFLLNFFKDLDADVITLINGDEKIPYYQLDNFLASSTQSLNDYELNNSSIFNYISNISKAITYPFLTRRINLSEIMNKGNNLINKMIKNNKEYKLINSDTINHSLSNLKELITKNFNVYEKKIFDVFNSKGTSIYSSLNKIFEVFNNHEKKSKLNYIIIISDGIIKENSGNIQDIISKAKEKNITIITILLSKKENEKKIYSECPKHLDKNLKNLFNLSSKVDCKNPYARQFIKKNWDFPKEGSGTLLFEANLKDMSNRDFTNIIKNATNEYYEIKIEDLNLENIIHFKFKFQTKNQIFGTCWANAYAAAILLANKRILGRKIESFETYRENIIKYACEKNSDGGDIDNENVRNYFNQIKLRFEKIKEEDIQSILMKGRFIICHFALTDKQWDNFSDFFKKHKNGILTRKDIDKGIDYKNIKKEDFSGHAVLLIEYNKEKNYMKFLNSWGSDFADNGTFKIKDGNVLTPNEFFDIFYYEDKDLSEEEKKYYSKNISVITEILNRFDGMKIEQFINYYNILSNQFYQCERCTSKIKIDYFKTKINNGIIEVVCQICHLISKPKGKFLELLILKNLLHDGNEDFDINYEEKNYLDIKRVPLHKDFSKNLLNDSDLCTIGFENSKENKIDSLFDKKINGIIWLKNNIFMACGSGEILVFRVNKKSFVCLMEKNFPDDELLTLCDLKSNDLIATGGKNLKIFKIDYSINYIKLEKSFKNEGIIDMINKIILIERKTPEMKKLLALSKINGNIEIYNIDDNEISLSFIKYCHNFYINCILYIPEDDILVSSCNIQQKIVFWEIKKDNLEEKNKTDIDSINYNDSLLDIKGNLLVGQKNGICVIQHDKGEIISKRVFYNNEFGGIFSMKVIDNDYFICGRNYGFCSIFKMRNSFIRKINIFRNNNLMFSENINKSNFKNDDYYITNICCAQINEKEGYILISSADNTLKAYTYNVCSNN